jgi:hypothetical protein
VIIFLPKTNLYYLLEEKIGKNNIVISDEKIKEGMVSLTLEEFNLNYRKDSIIEIKKADIYTYGLFNYINIDKLKINKLFNKEFSNAKVIYSIIDPLNLKLYTEYKSSTLNMDINLIDKKIKVSLLLNANDKKEFSKEINYMKKSKNGDYKYEYNF